MGIGVRILDTGAGVAHNGHMTTTETTTTTPDHTCTTCGQETDAPGECTICGGDAQALCTDCARPIGYDDDVDDYYHLTDAARGCFMIGPSDACDVCGGHMRGEDAGFLANAPHLYTCGDACDAALMADEPDPLPTTPAEWIAACGARKLTRGEVVAIADGTAARTIAEANR